MADLATSAPEIAEETPVRWTLLHRIGFRFVCAYLTLYCLPGPFTSFPGGQYVAMPFNFFWTKLSPWVAIHIFHLSGQRTTYFPTGSGDTTLQYIRNLLILVIALAATLIWSALDRKRTNYHALHGWLRLLVRYTLAFTLFGYGFAKVFPVQFQPANFLRLTEPFGQFSPMGVLWSFMGASIPYIIFAGSAEVAGGLLLLFRRTATLGALVSAAVLANVVALNFCYDVPVKLYSSNLLMMAIFLAAPDAKRLIHVLVLNRPAPPRDLSAPRFEKRWLQRALVLLWLFVVGFQFYSQIRSGWSRAQQAYFRPPQSPIGGGYELESFRADGKDLTTPTDPNRWRRLDFEANFMMAEMFDQSRLGYGATYSGNTVALSRSAQVPTETMTWSRPDATHLTLEGKLDGRDVSMRLRRVELSSFPLNSRGFHWISEFPYNR